MQSCLSISAPLPNEFFHFLTFYTGCAQPFRVRRSLTMNICVKFSNFKIKVKKFDFWGVEEEGGGTVDEFLWWICRNQMSGWEALRGLHSRAK